MIKHWINGKEVSSEETFTNYNPATNQAIGEVASGGQREIDLAVAAAKSIPTVVKNTSKRTCAFNASFR